MTSRGDPRWSNRRQRWRNWLRALPGPSLPRRGQRGGYDISFSSLLSFNCKTYPTQPSPFQGEGLLNSGATFYYNVWEVLLGMACSGEGWDGLSTSVTLDSISPSLWRGVGVILDWFKVSWFWGNFLWGQGETRPLFTYLAKYPTHSQRTFWQF